MCEYVCNKQNVEKGIVMGITPQSQKILDIVKEKCARAAEPLAHIPKAGAEDVHPFVFDIGGLPDFLTKFIRTHPKHKAVFDQLASQFFSRLRKPQLILI